MEGTSNLAQSAWAEWPIDREIVISRVIDAPRDLVYSAWTDPEQIQTWFGPEGFAIETKEIGLAAGGVWRFDMVALVLSLVLLRLEALEAPTESARLTELFIDDMDGQIRQIGFGDIVVGKQIGRMVGALGGRLSAYRAGLNGEASLSDALVRNLYRGEAPAVDALAYVDAQVRTLAAEIGGRSRDELLAGRLRG